MTSLRALADLHEIERVHAHLLLPAFSVEQLVTAELLCDGVASGETEVLVLTEGGVATAIAVGDFSDGVTLLSYLAVHSSGCGEGRGATLLTAVLDRWVASPQHGQIVLAEAEDPASHSLSPKYHRVGGMMLLALRIEPSALDVSGSRLMHVEPVVRMLEGYFDWAEGSPRPDDPASRAIFAALEAEGGVRLLDPRVFLATTSDAA